MANVKRQFLKSYSLGSVFKRRRDTPYQPWEEDTLLETPDPIEGRESPPRSAPATSSVPPVQIGDLGLGLAEREPVEGTDTGAVDVDVVLDRKEGSCSPSLLAPGSVHLVDCFYLGACDMTGHTIRGRGCIDDPAGRIWEQTQQKRRKNSLPSSFRTGTTSSDPPPNPFRPKYVRLVAGKDDLQMFDDITNERLGDFSYRKISFVGTHPKYNRLFAFIAEGKDRRTPYCYAFKCEDKESAVDTANTLSTVFEKKIAELLAESDRLQRQQKQTIQVDVSATLMD